MRKTVFWFSVLKVFFIACGMCALIGLTTELFSPNPFSWFMFSCYTFGGGIILTSFAIDYAVKNK